MKQAILTILVLATSPCLAVNTACDAPSVFHGETATVTCNFDVDISVEKHDFEISRYSQQSKNSILKFEDTAPYSTLIQIGQLQLASIRPLVSYDIQLDLSADYSQPTSLTAITNAVINKMSEKMLACHWFDSTTLECDQHPMSSHNGTVSSIFVYHIHNASQDHAGLYVCHVLPVETESYEFCILIVKNETRVDVNNYTVEYNNDTATVTCHFNVDLNATSQDFKVEFYINRLMTEVILACHWIGNILDCYKHADVIFDGIAAKEIRFQILNATVKHSGEFACHIMPQSSDNAFNNMTVKDLTTVTASFTPSPFAVKGNISGHSVSCSYTLAQGEKLISVTLFQETTQVASLFQSYNAVWEDNDVASAIKQRAHVSGSTGTQRLSITFNDTACLDEKQYTCIINVLDGSTMKILNKSSITVPVKAIPKCPVEMLVNPNTDNIEEFTNVTYTCSANVGKPAGSFHWFIISKNVTENATHQALMASPVQVPRDCTFIRNSSLTVNMTHSYNGLVVTCRIYHPLFGNTTYNINCVNAAEELCNKSQALTVNVKTTKPPTSTSTIHTSPGLTESTINTSPELTTSTTHITSESTSSSSPTQDEANIDTGTSKEGHSISLAIFVTFVPILVILAGPTLFVFMGWLFSPRRIKEANERRHKYSAVSINE